jgi:two-component system response regulator WspF
LKVAIVNDMPLAIEALQRALAHDASLQVCWVARSGEEAITRCAVDRPDVMLMDLIMPGIDGVETTRRIMASTPCAIVIVTGDVQRQTNRIFEAMGHGALDVTGTPALGGQDAASEAASLLRKIRNVGWLIGRAAVARKPAAAAPAARSQPGSLLAIGASAGGPAALAQLLAQLPVDFPAAVVLVQHVDAAFAAGMADWLATQVSLPVRLARVGERPLPGTVLLAGTADHLRLLEDQTLDYCAEPRAALYRPSIDVFFDSVSRHWRGPAVGVLLTGMGRDGAEGLKSMRQHGFLTIAQDQATSAVYGMPKAAAAIDAADRIMPLGLIAPLLITHFAPNAPRQAQGSGDDRGDR